MLRMNTESLGTVGYGFNISSSEMGNGIGVTDTLQFYLTSSVKWFIANDSILG